LPDDGFRDTICLRTPPTILLANRTRLSGSSSSSNVSSNIDGPTVLRRIPLPVDPLEEEPLNLRWTPNALFPREDEIAGEGR
jgi:hypothetical protein